jgi:tRNA modification GTPase
MLKARDQEDESVPPSVAVSAVTGEGIQALEQVIIQCLGMGEAGTTSPFSARERHVTCLKRAQAVLDAASDRFKVSQAGELLAEDLRRVHAELGAITGTFGADDLLGEIFSSFCIGK